MSELRLPVLKTERLEIRPLTMDDLGACLPLWQDPEACREWLAWQTLAYEQLDRLCQPPYGERAVVVQGSGAFVGLAGLVPSFDAFGRLPFFGASSGAQRSTEMGLYWALLPEHRGKGHATEAARALIAYAFTTLGLGRIVATTERDNAPSIAVMQRLGMRIEENPGTEPASLQVVGVLTAPGVAP